MLVARRVQKVAEQQDDKRESGDLALADFRCTPAWVLLGEPGSGKSEALKIEAKETGGEFLTASTFINSHPMPPQWRGKTLFIDAMDEARASGTNSLALRIANQLRQLDCPAFRLSCRAADWLGSMDKVDLQDLSPDGKLLTLQLSPLTDSDIREILQFNHGVADSEAFVTLAEHHRIKPLLHNPQTLGLIAKAIRGDQWPDNREQVYRLACETLAHENNRRHRDQQRDHVIDDKAVMHAAGQLFATLLLAGKRGIARDEEAGSDEFPTAQQLSPENPTATERALQSALFIPSGQHDEQLIPCHRSVAEYLAATWLTDKLDKHQLPLGRLLNLLLGYDGGVVADLRGLFAWLAQCSVSARHRLLDIDPLGIVLYGDASPFVPADKRLLLQALRKQAEAFPGFRWHLHHDQEAFGALADSALADDFRAILQNEDREEANQSHMDCVLEILTHGAVMPELAETLLTVAKDSSLWLRLRTGALKAWLRLCNPEDAKTLLDMIIAGLVDDSDDELLAKLLVHLYPDHLTPTQLMQSLHIPKDSRLIGSYRMFWDHDLIESAPIEHLPELLSSFNSHTAVFDENHALGELSRAVGRLIAKALEAYGDSAADDDIYKWLGAGADKYGQISRDTATQCFLTQWFLDRPTRYKALLKRCIHARASNSRSFHFARLPASAAPSDIGSWYLHEASSASEAVGKVYLANAVELLIQNSPTDLTLETLASWSKKNSQRAPWLEEFLFCPIEQWHFKHAKSANEYRAEFKEERHQRTIDIIPLFDAIYSGTAPAHALDHLSCVWLDHFSDIHGKTISERFANYSDLGDRLMHAAESGFKLSLQRDDLPSADEIIALYLKKQRYWISQPCLLGLQLLWEENSAQVLALPDALTEQLLAFRISTAHLELQEWLAQTALQRPTLFASLLIRYVTAALKQGDTSIEMVYLISRNDAFDQVAALAAPEILKSFPLRAKKEQLGTLERLLEVVHTKAADQFKPLVEHKLTLKGMDSVQKTLWYSLALLLEPERYEQQLWRHIGKSNTRAAFAAEYLCERRTSRIRSSAIPEYTLGRLIELITPDADFERKSGAVTEAMQWGDQVRSMVDMLGASTTPQAEKTLQKLLEQPALQRLRYKIQDTLHQQHSKRREEQFRFLDIDAVTKVLANRGPIDNADLAALCLALLDDIAYEIRHSNDDFYRTFWNVETGKSNVPRAENLCRDDLFRVMRQRLTAHGISSAPEADHAGDKRADLYLDYRNQFTLPIEIKRDSHGDLWKALRNQLIAQYINAPKSRGYGIYLVLWFNDAKYPMPATLDGGKKPKSPQELQTRLEALLNEEERQRIFIRVLDVSWPK